LPQELKEALLRQCSEQLGCSEQAYTEP
jgi:hypothetical protein